MEIKKSNTKGTTSWWYNGDIIRIYRFLEYASILWKTVYLIEGSLEVKLRTVWTDGKAEVGRVREEKRRREKIREEKESEERRCRCAQR